MILHLSRKDREINHYVRNATTILSVNYYKPLLETTNAKSTAII